MTDQCKYINGPCRRVEDGARMVLCLVLNKDMTVRWRELCREDRAFFNHWWSQRNGKKATGSKPQKLTEEELEALTELGVEGQVEEGLIKQWRKAIRRWRKAGKPVRTDKEVGRLLTICVACKYYKLVGGVYGRCTKCGCGVNRLNVPQLNKLRMATEGCPIKKFPAKVKVK